MTAYARGGIVCWLMLRVMYHQGRSPHWSMAKMSRFRRKPKAHTRTYYSYSYVLVRPRNTPMLSYHAMHCNIISWRSASTITISAYSTVKMRGRTGQDTCK